MLGDSAQSLTATPDGVWVDGSLRAAAEGGETHTFTLFFDTRRTPGNVTGSWCDAIDTFSEPGLRTAARRAAVGPGGIPQLRLAGRRVRVPDRHEPARSGRRLRDEPGHLSAARRHALRADARRGRPLSLRAAPSASADEGWLEGPVHITREPEPEGLRDSWPVSARAPLAAIATEPGRTPGDLGAGALAAGPDGTVLRYQPGQGWTREFLLSSSGTVVRSSAARGCLARGRRARMRSAIWARCGCGVARPGSGSATRGPRSATRRI